MIKIWKKVRFSSKLTSNPLLRMGLAQAIRFNSKPIQQVKSGAKGLGIRKSWLLPHNLG